MDLISALKLLRIKGFTGPIDIETGVRDNALVADGLPIYDDEHAQRHRSTVRIYDHDIIAKGGELEEVIREQVLKQHS